MVEEREPEYRGKCRDPYPTIAEKAYGKAGRWFSLVCIIGVQYGTGVGFLILLAKFREEFNSLIQVFKMMSKLIMKSRQFHLIHWSSRSLVTTSWCISTFCLGWLRADWLCSGRWWLLPSAGLAPLTISGSPPPPPCWRPSWPASSSWWGRASTWGTTPAATPAIGRSLIQLFRIKLNFLVLVKVNMSKHERSWKMSNSKIFLTPLRDDCYFTNLFF